MGTATHFRRVDELFRAAIRVAAPERRAWVDAACAADPATRDAVLALLREDAHEGGALDAPVVGASALRDSMEQARRDHARPVPATIGRYRIVREIGRGGMGIVYEAIQERPQRTVALKVISAALASRAMLRRFDAEAEALARLEHPGIATIFEAGVFEVGGITQPFFAMEFVRGRPIGDFVRAKGLDLPARLALVALVSDAVQHAHQRGVIHRDLKSSNVLVVEPLEPNDEGSTIDGVRLGGRPKILDFGVARLSDRDPSLDAATHTGPGQIVGTLDSMSPEQAEGDSSRVDTRSDVYALGVLAYELLAGRPALPLRGAPLHEALRIIREVDPAPLGSIDRRLGGDAGTIVAKALAKAPSDRYQSAGELSADIRRALRDEPILARPPGVSAVLRRFARRHTALVAAAAIAMLLVIGGVAAVWREAIQARTAQAAAEAESASARRRTVRAVLDSAAHELERGRGAAASARLEEVPTADRGFEWRLRRSRLDDAFARLPSDAPIVAVGTPDDGGRAWTLSRHGTLTRWDLFDAKPLEARSLGELSIGTAAIAGDGSAVLAVVDDGGLRLRAWHAPAHEPVDLGGVPRRARQVALSPDGRWGALAFASTGLDLVDLGTRVRRTILTEGTVQDLGFDAANRLIWTAGGDVNLMECERGTVTFHADVGVQLYSIDVDAEKRRVAVGGRDGSVRIWDIDRGEEIARWAGHLGYVRGVRFIPGEARLVSVGQERSLRVWPLDDGTGPMDPAEPAASTTPTTAADPAGPVRFAGPSSTVTAGILTAGPALALTRSGGAVEVWRPSEDVERRTRLPHDHAVTSVAVTSDSARIVTAAGGTVRVWCAATRELLQSIERAGDDEVQRLAPATAGAAPTNLEGEVVVKATLEARIGTEIHALAISPDGSRIACGSDEGDIHLFERSSGDEMTILSGHAGPVRSLAFSPDGTMLVSGSDDGTARIWDTLPFHERRARAASGCAE